MTHFTGVDFNSLYPSVCASEQHSFINYSQGRFLMPGRMLDIVTYEPKCLKLINNKANRINTKYLFVAKVKGHIPKEYISEYINFLPIIRNIDINMNEQTIGPYMMSILTNNNMNSLKNERKLTQLKDTNDEFMAFSSYYLWYLIDRFHFVIDAVESVTTFTASTPFNSFVNEFMSKRQEAMLENKKGKAQFYKITLNGSYGYDAMNTEKYTRSQVLNYAQTLNKIGKASYQNVFALKTSDDPNDCVFQVISEPTSYKCTTCIHEAVFTLDNAKVWYLTFIYDFMHKCLDMERLHFIEGDTDSAYWAIAGDPNDANTQTFKHVIKDHEFYNKHIYKFATSDFYSSGDCRPTFETELERMGFDKKLLGLAVEKQDDNMVALSPKCYTTFPNDNTSRKVTRKVKGLSIRNNSHITEQSYLKVLETNEPIEGSNNTLQAKCIDSEYVMSRLEIVKTALSSRHTKAWCKANGSCLPLGFEHYI